MKGFMGSIAVGACLLALSAGVAFATNLHNPANTLGNSATPNGTGQTGSNVLSSCSTGGITGLGTGFSPGNSGAPGQNSPFNQSVSKTYAGNPGNPTFPGSTNPPMSPGNAILNSNRPKDVSVSQYDNACAQAQVHSQLH
jgi:hypothetical protein